MEFDHGCLSYDRARPIRPAPCMGETPDARQGPPGPPSGLVRLVHARSAVDPPDPQGDFFAEEIKGGRSGVNGLRTILKRYEIRRDGRG